MLDLIVSVPDHCLSFYLDNPGPKQHIYLELVASFFSLYPNILAFT